MKPMELAVDCEQPLRRPFPFACRHLRQARGSRFCPNNATREPIVNEFSLDPASLAVTVGVISLDDFDTI
jgi:hypothetical protein